MPLRSFGMESCDFVLDLCKLLLKGKIVAQVRDVVVVLLPSVSFITDVCKQALSSCGFKCCLNKLLASSTTRS